MNGRMTHHSRLIAAALLLVGLTMAPHAQQSPLIDQLKAKYSPTKTIKLEFDLSIFWKVREKTETKSGSVIIAGDKFRAELGSTLWVCDGTTYWQYSKASNQVIIKRLADVDLSSHPSQLIETYLTKYKFTTTAEDDNSATLAWQAPAGAKDETTRAITLWVDKKKGTIKKLLTVDKSGNENTYSFKKSEFGIQVPPATFTFTPPQGASILDSRE
jgi:outer membrane lipoprotein-sorting protein